MFNDDITNNDAKFLADVLGVNWEESLLPKKPILGETKSEEQQVIALDSLKYHKAIFDLEMHEKLIRVHAQTSADLCYVMRPTKNFHFANQIARLDLMNKAIKQVAIDAPIFFIAQEPSQKEKNHYIFGILKDKNLFIIAPNGMNYDVVFFQELAKIKAVVPDLNCYLSSTQLQPKLDKVKQETSAFLCAELMVHRNDLLKLLEKNNTTTAINYEGFEFKMVDINAHLPASIAEIQNSTSTEAIDSFLSKWHLNCSSSILAMEKQEEKQMQQWKEKVQQWQTQKELAQKQGVAQNFKEEKPLAPIFARPEQLLLDKLVKGDVRFADLDVIRSPHFEVLCKKPRNQTSIEVGIALEGVGADEKTIGAKVDKQIKEAREKLKQKQVLVSPLSSENSHTLIGYTVSTAKIFSDIAQSNDLFITNRSSTVSSAINMKDGSGGKPLKAKGKTSGSAHVVANAWFSRTAEAEYNNPKLEELIISKQKDIDERVNEDKKLFEEKLFPNIEKLYQQLLGESDNFRKQQLEKELQDNIQNLNKTFLFSIGKLKQNVTFNHGAKEHEIFCFTLNGDSKGKPYRPDPQKEPIRAIKVGDHYYQVELRGNHYEATSKVSLPAEFSAYKPVNQTVICPIQYKYNSVDKTLTQIETSGLTSDYDMLAIAPVKEHPMKINHDGIRIKTATGYEHLTQEKYKNLVREKKFDVIAEFLAEYEFQQAILNRSRINEQQYQRLPKALKETIAERERMGLVNEAEVALITVLNDLTFGLVHHGPETQNLWHPEELKEGQYVVFGPNILPATNINDFLRRTREVDAEIKNTITPSATPMARTHQIPQNKQELLAHMNVQRQEQVFAMPNLSWGLEQDERGLLKPAETPFPWKEVLENISALEKKFNNAFKDYKNAALVVMQAVEKDISAEAQTLFVQQQKDIMALLVKPETTIELPKESKEQDSASAEFDVSELDEQYTDQLLTQVDIIKVSELINKVTDPINNKSALLKALLNELKAKEEIYIELMSYFREYELILAKMKLEELLLEPAPSYRRTPSPHLLQRWLNGGQEAIRLKHYVYDTNDEEELAFWRHQGTEFVDKEEKMIQEIYKSKLEKYIKARHDNFEKAVKTFQEKYHREPIIQTAIEEFEAAKLLDQTPSAIVVSSDVTIVSPDATPSAPIRHIGEISSSPNPTPMLPPRSLLPTANKSSQFLSPFGVVVRSLNPTMISPPDTGKSINADISPSLSTQSQYMFFYSGISPREAESSPKESTPFLGIKFNKT